MKKYIGKKEEINAKPMTRQEYVDFRGWELPADENGADEGYLVEYVDGGKPNTTEYKGYVSWSPKNVFEHANKPAETPLDRLCIEYDELLDNFNKLNKFCSSGDMEKIVGELQADLMRKQWVLMGDYLLLLKTRIELMKR